MEPLDNATLVFFAKQYRQPHRSNDEWDRVSSRDMWTQQGREWVDALITHGLITEHVISNILVIYRFTDEGKRLHNTLQSLFKI